MLLAMANTIVEPFEHYIEPPARVPKWLKNDSSSENEITKSLVCPSATS